MVLDIFAEEKLVVGKTIMLLISLLLRSVVRRQFVWQIIYIPVSTHLTSSGFFLTDNGQIL